MTESELKRQLFIITSKFVEERDMCDETHIHSELIKAWADGAQIECLDKDGDGEWHYCESPDWYENVCYRVKSES